MKYGIIDVESQIRMENSSMESLGVFHFITDFTLVDVNQGITENSYPFYILDVI